MQTDKQSGGTQPTVKTRKQATRAKPAFAIRPKASQNDVKEKPTPQQGQRQALYVKETTATPALEFRPCALVGPDRQSRPGWGLWVGGMMFGRADAKETLLAYYSRLHEPLPSGHWKDRAWQPMKKKPTGRRSREEPDPQFDDEAEVEPEPEIESSWKE